jgi:ComF family protein
MNLVVPLLDLLFPPRCVFCRARVEDDPVASGVCAACITHVPHPSQCCDKCGQPLTGAAFCSECAGRNFSFTAACAVNEYQGALKSAIHKFKYKGRKELAGPLGSLLARQIRLSGWPRADAVVPVPLHYEKLQSRGYDQALLLAQVVGDELQLPVKRMLVRQKATTSQTRLQASERWKNVSGVFASLGEQDPPSRVILIDDLLTTGATAHFAGLQLLRAGVGELFLAVVGR